MTSTMLAKNSYREREKEKAMAKRRTNENIEKAVIRELARATGWHRDQIGPNATLFFNLGLDDREIANILCQLETEFRVDLRGVEIALLENVRDIIQLVKACRDAGRHLPTANQT